MIVCVCKRVSSARVKEAVSEGATGVEELGEKLGLGTGCGRCLEFAERMVEREKAALSYDAAVA
jgi:bacterioferritin-associated ferredoxin